MIPSLIAPQAVTQDFNIWSFIIQIITTAKFSSTSLVTKEANNTHNIIAAYFECVL
jgi:hypothetical protein